MIKLSDYLNYLNSEVVQARKKADNDAIKMALEYGKDPYLKFFRVPRFSMPMVKMDIPIKISKINADTKYDFKMNNEDFIADVNKRIIEVNRKKRLNLEPITHNSIKNDEFLKMKEILRKRSSKFTNKKDEYIRKIDFSKIISRNVINRFSAESAKDKKEELTKILKDSILSQYTPVSVKLKEIFIDPDTSKDAEIDKLLLNLHVEMEDEGIRIVQMRDKDGKEIEEIIFE